MKSLKDITGFEWALFEWIDVTPAQSAERLLVRGKERTPSDAVQAHKDYLEWIKLRRAALKRELGE